MSLSDKFIIPTFLHWWRPKRFSFFLSWKCKVMKALASDSTVTAWITKMWLHLWKPKSSTLSITVWETLPRLAGQCHIGPPYCLSNGVRIYGWKNEGKKRVYLRLVYGGVGKGTQEAIYSWYHHFPLHAIPKCLKRLPGMPGYQFYKQIVWSDPTTSRSTYW